MFSINVVVSIRVSVFSHKHRVDYITVHYVVQTTCYVHTTNKNSQMAPFLIAGHIYD